MTIKMSCHQNLGSLGPLATMTKWLNMSSRSPLRHERGTTRRLRETTGYVSPLTKMKMLRRNRRVSDSRLAMRLYCRQRQSGVRLVLDERTAV